MIIQNQTNANQNINQVSANNGVTFTDKPVESQAPVSAAPASEQANVAQSQAPASASVSEQSAAPVSAKASVAPSEAASQAPASAASQAVRSQTPASQAVESAAPTNVKSSAAVKNVANNKAAEINTNKANTQVKENAQQKHAVNAPENFAVNANNLANPNRIQVQGAYCNALNTINVALNHQMSGDLKSQIQFSNGGGIKSVTQNGNMLTITTNQDMDFQNKMEIRIPSQNIVYDVREEIGKDMGVVRTAAFDNKYTYNGNDLGVTYTPTRSTFKIWAPTASAIEVNTYENDTDPNSKAKNHYSMKYVGQGVWEVTVQGDLNNTAYDYTIHFADGATNETYDPYATACVEGGYRSVVLAPSETGVNVSSIGKDDPTNEVIGEIHIRDFTNNPSSGVPAKLRGTYLGAVYQGSKNASGQATGLDYLKQQGINTVQIQPAFQYDDGGGKTYQYNWGYNPENYNIPEGWYSTNRDDPATRIKEFKEMVQAFHKNGIRVNMDVVYNHVGNYGKNALASSVPGYYFSYDGNGNLTNASACGNDVASERNMVRNYIVHSVKYWHDVYGVDGFRFDLMGNLDVKTMNAIRAALPNCVLYGEGWNMGANIPANTRADQANENQMPTVGTFNGWGRTIIRGSDDGKQHGYITGNDSQATMSSLANFIYGSQNAKNTPSDAYDSGVNYVNPGQLINYTECHDNKTLWDTIVAAYPNESADLTMRRAELGNAITILNQGVPYLQVGQGFGRSKDGNGNSYNAGDAVNNINWNRENQFPWAVSYEKALLQLRAADPGFRMTSFSDIDKNFKWIEIGNNGVIGYQLTSPATGRTYIVAFSNNGSTQQLTGLQNGKYKVLIKNCNGYVTDPQELTVTNGSTDIPSLSCLVLEVDNAAAQKPLISNNNNNQKPANKPATNGSQSTSKPTSTANKSSQAGSAAKGSTSANNPTGGKASASAANKGSQAKSSQANSAAKGSASVAGQSQGKTGATPGQSREPASNPNDVQHGGNTPASAAKGSTSANKPATSVGDKTSQAGGHTANAGKTSATPTNKTSQGSAAVKGSVSASKTSASAGKTQAQSQSANGSAAKGSVSVNQSLTASQSGKGNQWQSQGQHVNVIKHPAKVVKASAPVAQLAAKRVASAPAEETTAPVAEQTSAPVETAVPATQQTAAAPAAKAATPSAAQSSGSSSSSMPNTGMNNEVTAELGMVGTGLVLGIAAKRSKKERK